MSTNKKIIFFGVIVLVILSAIIALYMLSDNADNETVDGKVQIVEESKSITQPDSNDKDDGNGNNNNNSNSNSDDYDRMYFYDSLYDFTTENIPYLKVRFTNTSEKIWDEELNVDVYNYKNVDDFIANNKELSSGDDQESQSMNKVRVDIDETLAKALSFKTTLRSSGVDRDYCIKFPEKLPEGYYLVDVSSAKYNCQTNVQVNDASVYIMYGKNESLAWVNDSKTGKAVSDATFKLEDGKSAKTNRDGVAVITNKADGEGVEQFYFKVSRKNHPTYIARVVANNVFGHDYSLPEERDITNDYIHYLYTDRKIYSSNDRIKLWGLVKPRENSKKIDSITATLYSKFELLDESEVITKELTLNADGYFNEDIELNDLVSNGYILKIKTGDKIIAKKYLWIKEHVKKPYTIESNFDKANIFLWDSAKLEVQANFPTGKPVSGLSLRGNYYQGSTAKEIPNIVCDENGYYQSEYKPSLATDTWKPSRIGASINNNQEEVNVYSEALINVFPKDIMININTKSNPTDKNLIDVEIDTNLIDINKAINKKITQPKIIDDLDIYKGKEIDRELDVSIYEISYKKVEEAEGAVYSGKYYDYVNKKIRESYQYEEDSKLLDKFNVNTKNGKYNMSLKISEDKSYKIVVETNDTRGNKVIEEVLVNEYVNDYNNYGQSELFNYYIKEKEASKENYKVGDTINLVLRYNRNRDISNESKGKLLLLKMKDSIQKVIVSDDMKESLIFNEADIPNFYISAAYFDGKKMNIVVDKKITYDYSEKALDIGIKTEYKPGDTVNLEFEVKDKAGSPQKTNIFFSVVDEKLFPIQDEQNNPLPLLYEYSYTKGIIQKDVAYLNDNLYRSTSEGGMTQRNPNRVDPEFLETAIYKTITTDSAGKGSISFQLPDNSTTWRLSYQGISENLLAGSGHINISVK